MKKNYSLVVLILCGLNSACVTTEGGFEKNEIYTISAKADEAYTDSDWITAEVNYTKLTSLVPDDARAFFKLGNIYLKQGKLTSSVAAYSAAISKDPDKAKYYNNLAIARIVQAKQALQATIIKGRPADVFITDAKIMLIRLKNINKRKSNAKSRTGSPSRSLTTR